MLDRCIRIYHTQKLVGWGNARNGQVGTELVQIARAVMSPNRTG